MTETTGANVTDQIAWRVEVSVKPGQVENLLALTDEMVESASAEEGCLSYQRFISPDGKSVHVYERYLNSGTALAHLKIFFSRFGKQADVAPTRENLALPDSGNGLVRVERS